MEADMTKYWISQGGFAALFVMLLIYVLKQNERRETRLMNFVEKIGPYMEELKRDVCEIKNKLKGD
jgi:hypothetical protein